MNHNFADWEITQFLPETNPYQFFEYLWVKEDRESEIELIIEYSDEYIKIRDAWTWEDIRLYLSSKGFVFTVWEYDKEYEDTDNRPKHYFGFIILIGDNYSSVNNDDKWYFSYEEARKAAIIYCLNLIKNAK